MSPLIDFQLFLILWNHVQGQKTPRIHLRIADWLQARWMGGDTRLLLMAFRSCGKSTIVGVFAAWLFYRNPDLRILVLAAEMSLARRMVRTVRRMIERHPLTLHLKPDNPDQWAGDRFTIKRSLELRDPSMLARGVDANITGSRADIVICDDVEVPNTCDTAGKRENLREVLSELEYILTPGGSMIYVGTPHSWYTIYADIPRIEIGETQVFLDGYQRLKVPILDEDGHSAWPERYSPETIARMKRQTGINKFTAQMMLVPVNNAEGRLNPGDLVRYDGDLHYSRELNLLTLNGRTLVSCSAFWDPAFGKGDSSVVAVVFSDEDGGLWVHDVVYLQSGNEDDRAKEQCQQVVAMAKLMHIPCITVESNGIGKFLPGILRKELAIARAACGVVEHTARTNKDQRILEAFQTVMAARLLHVHERVFKTPFITEMQEWRPGRSSGRDDGLDAVAGALALQPMRLKIDRFGGRQSWQSQHKNHQARTDFDV